MNGVLDFTDKECKRYYQIATKSLFPSDELYECNTEDMNHLLTAVGTRAKEYKWDDETSGVRWIPEDHTDSTSELDYLPKEYGKVDMERITKFEKSYLGQEIRSAQDSYML